MNKGKKIIIISTAAMLVVAIVATVVLVLYPTISKNSSSGDESSTNESISQSGDDDIQKQLDETIKSINENEAIPDQAKQEKAIEAMEKARKQYSDNGNASRAAVIEQQIETERASSGNTNNGEDSVEPNLPEQRNPQAESVN